MASRADELLGSVELDVLADIGWQLSEKQGQIGAAPKSVNELVALGRRWFSANYKGLKDKICPEHDRIKNLLINDKSQAIQAIGDCCLGLATGIAPFTATRLVIQIGIDNLCKE